MTPVEWLINEIDMQYPEINIKYKQWMIDQAREMEKQQELSDEEIEKAAIDFYTLSTNFNAFIKGAKWYREQLKQRK